MKPIYVNKEHEIIIEKYLDTVCSFAEQCASKPKYLNYLDVIDTIAQPGMPTVLGPNINTDILLDDNGNPNTINSVNPCEYIYGCTCPNYIEYYDIIEYDNELNFNFNQLNSLLNNCDQDCNCDFNYNFGCTQLIPPVDPPTFDNGSCENLLLYGCTDPNALNYNPEATINDCLSCIPPINIDFEVIQPECFDNLNGELNFEVLGGVPPYSYYMYNILTNEEEQFNNLLEGQGIEMTNINPGEYFLEFTDFEGYSSSISFAIVFPDNININIWESGGWLNTLDGYDSYEWTLNGNLLSGNQFNSFQIYPTSSGLYGVTVSFEYDDGTCISETIYYDYQLFQNTIQENDHFLISCTPNPAYTSSIIYIKSNTQGILNLCLYDGFGKKIWTDDKIINNKNNLIINGLNAGMYYLYVTSDKSHSIVPIMILK